MKLSNGFLRLFFAFSLFPVKPVSAARAHHGSDTPPGDRMDGLSDSRRRQSRCHQNQQPAANRRSLRALIEDLSSAHTAVLGKLRHFDALGVAMVAWASFLSLCFLSAAFCQPARSSLAVLAGGVEAGEDAPAVSQDYKFLPGDFVYFTFEVGGFSSDTDPKTETRKIALTYELVPEDMSGIALTAPVKGEIKEELHPEDKNWMPKRRASFLLPSFLAAGDYRIHVYVQDGISKAETTADFPFRIGGVQIKTSRSITVENFRFLRSEEDSEPLAVPAYSPGDTVYVRFDMTGYKFNLGNAYRLAYGLTVIGPDGKPFIEQPHAAELQSSSFYPAHYVPGNLDLTTKKDSPAGAYTLVLTVHDLIGNTAYEIKRAFSLER